MIWFDKHIYQSPKIFYELLFQAVNVAQVLEKPFFAISTKLQKIAEIKRSYILFVIYAIFNIIPKSMLSCSFLIELTTIVELNGFYKMLWLGLIPITYNALLRILGNLADKNPYFATAHVDITYHSDGSQSLRFREKIPPIEDPIDILKHCGNQGLGEWFIYMYDTYCPIKWLVYLLSLVKERIKPYETLIISPRY